jgi:hypothetical protein
LFPVQTSGEPVQLGSEIPLGGVTVAVFVMLPDVVAVPVTTIVNLFAAPDEIFPVRLILFPLPELVPHDAEPVELQVHETPVIFAGTASAIVAPVTFAGPLFVTSNV